MITNSELEKDNISAWFEENFLPKIAKKIGKTYVNATLDITVPENCFYISTVYFVAIKFDNDDECTHVVIKKLPEQLTYNAMVPVELFQNEFLFYDRIATGKKKFPRCFYVSTDPKNISNNVIITENIEKFGYKMFPKAYDIPYEYVIAGMQEIGRFHAMSYVMKLQNPQGFYKIVEDIKETRYQKGPAGELFAKFIHLNARRSTIWLRKNNYDSKFCDKIERHLKNAFENVMLNAVNPVEPLAVICHGDFTRNNIFFKKTSTGLDAMLIDFAMLTYGSPCVDLSTFLYLNCSSADRKHRFNDIFSAYHESLTKYLNGENIKDQESYSYDKMLQDYKRKALFGYMITLFYLPLLRGFVVEQNFDISDFDIEDVPEEFFKVGEELSEEFADMLLELKEQGCLDHIKDY